MLKIKDNVTYQKLNKLGFRKDNFNERYDYEVEILRGVINNENSR